MNSILLWGLLVVNFSGGDAKIQWVFAQESGCRSAAAAITLTSVKGVCIPLQGGLKP